MNQREVFEKWWEDHGLQDDGEDSQYSVAAYSWANRAWQAATSIERESCAKVCDHYATAIDLRGNEYIRSGDCKRAAELIRDRK